MAEGKCKFFRTKFDHEILAWPGNPRILGAMNAISPSPTALLTEPIGVLGGVNILQLGVGVGVVLAGALAIKAGIQRLFNQ